MNKERKMEKNKKGFTLVETLLAVGVAGATSSLLIHNQSMKDQDNEMEKFSNELYSIISAMDKRLDIDGYDESKWSKQKWNNESEIVTSLLTKEFIAKDSNCANGTWEPEDSAAKEVNLVQCDLWKNRKGLDLTMSAEITKDSVDFIQGLDLYLTFNEVSVFEENFIRLKSKLSRSFSGKEEVTGFHSYSYVDFNDKNKEIGSIDCINDPLHCTIKLSYDRMDGKEYQQAEYLKTDGSSSILGDNLTFIDSAGNAPLKCVRWSNEEKDGSGVWIRNITEECGIGFYKEGANPIMLDVVSKTGTFENILLDKECVVYELLSGEKIPKDLGKKSACGVYSDSEVYQVVENISSMNGYFDEYNSKNVDGDTLKTKNLDVAVANIDKIIARTIGVEELNIDSELKFKDTTVVVNFNDSVTFEKDMDMLKTTTLEATSNAIFNKKLNIDKDLNGNGHKIIFENNLLVNNQVGSKNLIASDLVNVSNNLKVNKNTEIENLKATKEVNWKGSDVVSDKTIQADALITSGEIKSDKGTFQTFNFSSTGSANASNLMKSPIGDFDNINLKINDLKRRIAYAQNNLNSKVSCVSNPQRWIASTSSCPSGQTGNIVTSSLETYVWEGASCKKKITKTSVTNNCVTAYGRWHSVGSGSIKWGCSTSSGPSAGGQCYPIGKKQTGYIQAGQNSGVPVCRETRFQCK